MELMQFTGEAKAILHALTKAIEGIGSRSAIPDQPMYTVSTPKDMVLELHERDSGMPCNRLAFLATEIAGVEEDNGHLAIIYMKSHRGDNAFGKSYFCVEEQYNDVLKAWREALS